MAGFSVTVSEAQLQQLDASIGKQSTRQAIYQAVKRTTARGVAILKEQIAADVNIQAKYIDKAITSSVSDDESGSARGVIRITKKGLPMSAFNPVAGSGGVTVIMTKSRGPLTLKHAFLARVTLNGGGHRGVFLRAKGRDSSGTKNRNVRGGFRYEGGRLTKAGYARRFPIEQMFGPSVYEIFGPEKLTVTGDRIMLKLNDVMRANLQSQMDRFLNQKKGTGEQLVA